MESHGNQNLLFVNGCEFITYAGTSKASTGLDPKTIAVDLYATTDCWVIVGDQALTPTAVKPAAELTVGPSFFLIAGVEKTIPVPIGKTGALVKLAVIQDAAGGSLKITQRRE